MVVAADFDHSVPHLTILLRLRVDDAVQVVDRDDLHLALHDPCRLVDAIAIAHLAADVDPLADLCDHLHRAVDLNFCVGHRLFRRRRGHDEVDVYLDQFQNRKETV